MKKRINQIVYCKDSNKDWITVFRHGRRYSKYSYVSVSTMIRLDRIQEHSTNIKFCLNDAIVDFLISMRFDNDI